MMIAKRHTLANALRVAAEQYDSAAHTSSCLPAPGGPRLEQGFICQAKEARELADAIEQADAVRLED